MTREHEYLDCELFVASKSFAKLSVEGREFEGSPRLDDRLRSRLLERALDPREYGAELFEAVFKGSGRLLQGYQAGLVLAVEAHRRVRLRVHVPTHHSELHALNWELMFDPEERIAPARWPLTAFSRYSPVTRPLGNAVKGRPRILAAIASPNDASRHGLAPIDRRAAETLLEQSFEPLANKVDVEILPGPTTTERLRERLAEQPFHLLHLVGHGLRSRNGEAALVLERDNGTTRFVDEELLDQVLSGLSDLRLVTLIACHGSTPSSANPLSGLAPTLVRSGLPAVVAMRDEIRMDTAVRFTRHFYRSLARDGVIDAAVNEARLQLYLADPDTAEWSFPVLFMRVRNGCLWEVSEAQPTEGTLKMDTAGEAAEPQAPPVHLDHSVYAFHGSVGQIFTIGQVEKLLNLPGPGGDRR